MILAGCPRRNVDILDEKRDKNALESLEIDERAKHELRELALKVINRQA